MNAIQGEAENCIGHIGEVMHASVSCGTHSQPFLEQCWPVTMAIVSSICGWFPQMRTAWLQSSALQTKAAKNVLTVLLESKVTAMIQLKLGGLWGGFQTSQFGELCSEWSVLGEQATYVQVHVSATEPLRYPFHSC